MIGDAKDMIVKKYFLFSGGRREWAVTGLMGSVSFWVEKSAMPSHGEYYGGVECHYNEKSKPDYFDGKEASQERCDFNMGKCWHDGTSLWASEYWIPHILPRGAEAIWQRLEANYRERFYNVEAE